MAERAADPQAASPIVWLGFSIMCVGMFMAILDVQVVATSLPVIQGALNIAQDQMSWIQTAYLTAEVIAIPLTGLLTRILTQRWLFVVAIAAFTAASLGCAASNGFQMLIGWRILQGFCAGALIPSVFAAVFLRFPVGGQGLATMVAGVVALFAPTIGPVVGGWITQIYSWHWLFLINVVPGLVCALAGAALLPRETADLGQVRRLDVAALALLTIGLAALEIGLKQAPKYGWLSLACLGPLGLFCVCGALFVARGLTGGRPIVDLRALADRRFAIGCLLSLILGMGLFGSIYLMPVFLAFVQGHDALGIGEIMLVTGLAQLAAAPVAIYLEQRVDARLLCGAGFAAFALGLGLSAGQTETTDFSAMLWPQIIRGAAMMFCLLPPTRLALGHQPLARIADCSGLFNLTRNLGGAIGLALVDTVIYGRAPVHVAAIAAHLKAGDVATARAVGIPVHLFLAQVGEPIDPDTEAMLRPMVEKLALTWSINEAWLMLAALSAAALVTLLFVGRPPGGPIPVRRADGASASLAEAEDAWAAAREHDLDD
jgi:DHA2 family multidrug resistance protein